MRGEMANADDGEASGDEAEAQREETIRPWIWGALGLIGIAVFMIWIMLWPAPRPHAPAPQMPAAGVPQPRTP